MSKALPAVFIAWGLAAFAVPGLEAQEDRDQPKSVSQEIVREGTDQVRVSVSLSGRFSVLMGNRTDEGNIAINRYDLFDTGLGVEGDFGLLWKVSRRGRLGGFMSLGWDHYDGLTTTGEAVDTAASMKLVPDALDTITFLAGPRYMVEADHLEMEMHLGFGVVHYSEVDGTVIGGPTPGQYTFLKASSGKFVFDVGLPSLAYRAGPLAIGFGISFRFQAAPENGNFFQARSEPAIVFGLRFGVELRF